MFEYYYSCTCKTLADVFCCSSITLNVYCCMRMQDLKCPFLTNISKPRMFRFDSQEADSPRLSSLPRIVIFAHYNKDCKIRFVLSTRLASNRAVFGCDRPVFLLVVLCRLHGVCDCFASRYFNTFLLFHFDTVS